MNNEVKLKIIVLGPVSTGKTSISNFLSDATENVTGENRPTKGVRIVEFLAEGLTAKDKLPYKAEVELWDCSGDRKYEQCWPSMLHETNGIIFVYNENSSQQKSDLEVFYNYFVVQPGFTERNCVLMFNRFGKDNNTKPANSPLPKIHHIGVNIEENGPELRKTFNSFLSAVIARSGRKPSEEADDV